MKDNNLYLGHMLMVARKVRFNLYTRSRADFDNDELIQLGFVHLLQTIGEAARHVSRDYQ